MAVCCDDTYQNGAERKCACYQKYRQKFNDNGGIGSFKVPSMAFNFTIFVYAWNVPLLWIKWFRSSIYKLTTTWNGNNVKRKECQIKQYMLIT